MVLKSNYLNKQQSNRERKENVESKKSKQKYTWKDEIRRKKQFQ